MLRARGLSTNHEQVESAKGTAEFLEQIPVAATEPDRDASANQFDDQDFSDEELEALLLREITIDGMCGVY